ncbi:MAG: tripartite tricarboxylate transporter substrate binding protein [Enhydrobacter sp.]|nr:tripartite tricarboxylate transporter substrate binding protein [Enhydrobacter sp.]
MIQRLDSQSRLGRRLTVGAMLAPFVARAESRLKQPIRVILPGTAGGIIDIAARAIGDAMQGTLGQPWLIDPRPGANGVIAAQAFLAAPAVDSTLYLTVTSHVVLPFLMRVPFDVIADFEPIAMIGDSTSLICVPPLFPANTIDGFVALARANRGKLNYLNAGTGTVTHLLPEMLKVRFDIDVAAVSYKGLPSGLLDLLNARLDLGVVSSGLAVDHVKAGRLKALAVVADHRLAALPQVSTLPEQNVGDLAFRTWLPLYGRKGIERSEVDRINRSVSAALSDPMSRRRLEAACIEPLQMASEEVGEVMRAEHERLGGFIRRLGISLEG